MNKIIKTFFVILIAAQIKAVDNSVIELITGKTEAKSYRPRINAIHKLDRHLSAKNINELYKFLDSYFTNQTDLLQLEFNAVKNDILNVLVRQKNIPTELGQKLIENYNNVQHDIVWRSYCVQHLKPYYDRKWRGNLKLENRNLKFESNKIEINESKKIRQTLWQAANETNSRLSGTSLKLLERLSQKHSEFDKQKIADLAFEIVKNKEANEELKTTAVSVCGKLNKKEVLPFAKQFAEQSNYLPLRSTSISVIGKLGSPADINFLKKFTDDKNIPIRTVAQTAIQNIEK